jgi:Uma2 family endonuclease
MTATLDATLDTVPPRLLDPEDLLSMPNGDDYELIDGIPVELDMSFDADTIAFDLCLMLGNYAKLHNLGRVCGAGTGFSAFPGRPKTLRKPDGMFFAKGRLPAGPISVCKVAPDLAIEVISPTNTALEIQQKITLYRSAGVRLTWAVYPETRQCIIHRLDGTMSQVEGDGILAGEDVVPGFECRIAALFEV